MGILIPIDIHLFKIPKYVNIKSPAYIFLTPLSPYIFSHFSLSLSFSLMFANGSVDPGSIPGRVIQKILKNGTWYPLA